MWPTKAYSARDRPGGQVVALIIRENRHSDCWTDSKVFFFCVVQVLNSSFFRFLCFFKNGFLRFLRFLRFFSKERSADGLLLQSQARTKPQVARPWVGVPHTQRTRSILRSWKCYEMLDKHHEKDIKNRWQDMTSQFEHVWTCLNMFEHFVWIVGPVSLSAFQPFRKGNGEGKTSTGRSI